jgi:hypothetical protein
VRSVSAKNSAKPSSQPFEKFWFAKLATLNARQLVCDQREASHLKHPSRNDQPGATHIFDVSGPNGSLAAAADTIRAWLTPPNSPVRKLSVAARRPNACADSLPTWLLIGASSMS